MKPTKTRLAKKPALPKAPSRSAQAAEAQHTAASSHEASKTQDTAVAGTNWAAAEVVIDMLIEQQRLRITPK
jgi:lysine/ornithine N-monooxygenase